MKEISIRFVRWVNNHGGASEVAVRIGKSPQSFYNYANRGSLPNMEILALLTKYYEDFDANYIITGGGHLNEPNMPLTEQQKFQQLIDYLGISVYQFGKELGIRRVEPIYKILRGETKDPGASLYAKIKRTFPKISSDWLILGVGDMVLEKQNISKSKDDRKN